MLIEAVFFFWLPLTCFRNPSETICSTSSTCRWKNWFPIVLKIRFFSWPSLNCPHQNYTHQKLRVLIRSYHIVLMEMYLGGPWIFGHFFLIQTAGLFLAQVSVQVASRIFHPDRDGAVAFPSPRRLGKGPRSCTNDIQNVMHLAKI